MTSAGNISFVLDVLKFNGGLQEPFTMNELKKAYKRTILKHHPDKGGNAETFKKIDGVFKQITGRNNVSNTKFFFVDIQRILRPPPISPRRPSPRVYTPPPPRQPSPRIYTPPPPQRNSFVKRLSEEEQMVLVRLLMLLPLFIYRRGRWVVRKILRRPSTPIRVSPSPQKPSEKKRRPKKPVKTSTK